MNGPSLRRKSIWVVSGFAMVLFGVLATSAGRALIVDAPERSDIVLVLAGETDLRPARGLELLSQGYGRRLVIDVPASERVYGFTEVQLAQKFIQDQPLGASVRVCPIAGLSTRDESHDVEKCLSKEEGARILIVTSDFHTRRALSIFHHEVPGKSFSVAAVRDERQFGTRWWTRRQWAKVCLEEWLRLVWWTAIDRWR